MWEAGVYASSQTLKWSAVFLCLHLKENPHHSKSLQGQISVTQLHILWGEEGTNALNYRHSKKCHFSLLAVERKSTPLQIPTGPNQCCSIAHTGLTPYIRRIWRKRHFSVFAAERKSTPLYSGPSQCYSIACTMREGRDQHPKLSIWRKCHFSLLAVERKSTPLYSGPSQCCTHCGGRKRPTP